jgi:hypothetical protein
VDGGEPANIKKDTNTNKDTNTLKKDTNTVYIFPGAAL